MKKIFLITQFVFILTILNISAQELNCIVQVSSVQIQATDKHVFETLQTALMEFMNNRKWTNHVYRNEERIDCNILINVTEWDMVDQFKATIQVQSRRPIYNTSYNSPIFNFQDKDFQFTYVEQQPLEFSETQHLSNLTSVLAFYAYLIIGLDYDTYSLYGGTEFYQKAEAIVNNAQSDSKSTGWRAFESDKNRYWIVYNMLDPIYKPLRECLYKYHLQGLDRLHKEQEIARNNITEALQLLKNVQTQKPGSIMLQLFFNAKADEIVNIYSAALPEEKAKIIKLLSGLDPANSNKYAKIVAKK